MLQQFQYYARRRPAQILLRVIRVRVTQQNHPLMLRQGFVVLCVMLISHKGMIDLSFFSYFCLIFRIVSAK